MVMLLFGSFFLVSNGFLAALAGAGVVLGGLTADGKTVTVTDAAVAADVHQTLDVELDLRTKVTLHLVVGADNLADLGGLLVGPVLYFDVAVNACLVQDFLGGAAADAEDVGQGYFTSFVLGEVNSHYSYCHNCSIVMDLAGRNPGRRPLTAVPVRPILSLTLFVLGILFVDHIQAPLAADYLRVRGAFLD